MYGLGLLWFHIAVIYYSASTKNRTEQRFLLEWMYVNIRIYMEKNDPQTFWPKAIITLFEREENVKFTQQRRKRECLGKSCLNKD